MILDFANNPILTQPIVGAKWRSEYGRQGSLNLASIEHDLAWVGTRIRLVVQPRMAGKTFLLSHQPPVSRLLEEGGHKWRRRS